MLFAVSFKPRQATKLLPVMRRRHVCCVRIQLDIRKIFTTRDHSVVEQCMIFFECHPVHDTVRERKKFLGKLLMSSNQLCVLFKDKAIADLSN